MTAGVQLPGEISVRKPESPAELDEINALNMLVFDKQQGVGAFDTLRRNKGDVVSLVAIKQQRVVGHACFSPVFVEFAGGSLQGMGLGELAVHPEHQLQGIGRGLVSTGLTQLHFRLCPFVIVIGVAKYYPKLGFDPGSAHSLKCQWPGIPDDSFMVKILNPGVMQTVSGVARYRDIP